MWILQHCLAHKKKLWSSYYISISPILQMQFTKWDVSRKDWMCLEKGRQLFLMSCYQFSLCFEKRRLFLRPIRCTYLDYEFSCYFQNNSCFWGGTRISISSPSFPFHPTPLLWTLVNEARQWRCFESVPSLTR